MTCPCLSQLVFFPLLMVTETSLQGIFRALRDHVSWEGCWSQVNTMGCLDVACQQQRATGSAWALGQEPQGWNLIY